MKARARFRSFLAFAFGIVVPAASVYVPEWLERQWLVEYFLPRPTWFMIISLVLPSALLGFSRYWRGYLGGVVALCTATFLYGLIAPWLRPLDPDDLIFTFPASQQFLIAVLIPVGLAAAGVGVGHAMRRVSQRSRPVA